MEVVFSIDAAGQLSEIGWMLRLAIDSCRACADVVINVVADGFTEEFAGWLDERGVRRHLAGTPLLPAILRAHRQSGYPLQAIGNYLRYAAIDVVDAEHLLYCDCDTIFLPGFEKPIIPHLVAAAAEDDLDDWSRFNSGVLSVNTAAFRNVLPAFHDFASSRLEAFYPSFDQAAFNAFFASRIERLPPALNWRPYWPQNEKVGILHTHGVKPSQALRVMRGETPLGHGNPQFYKDLLIRTAQTMPFYFRWFHEYVGPARDLWCEVADQAWTLIERPVPTHADRMARMREEVSADWVASESSSLDAALERAPYRVRGRVPEGTVTVRLLLTTGCLLCAMPDPAIIGLSSLPLVKATRSNVVECDQTVAARARGASILRKVAFRRPMDFVFRLDTALVQGENIEVLVYAASPPIAATLYWAGEDVLFSEDQRCDLQIDGNATT